MKKITTLALAAMMLAPSVFNSVMAASDTASANATVIAAISIANVSNLEFGSAAQGDASKTVAPGAAENAENASFDVTGEANTAYSITLPNNGVVVMETGAGGANETIAVDDFASTPAAGANGLLDGTGAQSLFVGATRAALGAAQVPGTYTTTFTVDVVY